VVTSRPDPVGPIGGDGLAVGLSDIEAVRLDVAKVAVRTPVFSSRVLSERLGAPVVFKAENLQRTGSFKIRGATAKLAALGSQASRGIVVASAGNHAQAAAFAARQAGVSCHVFMPQGASISKAEATEAYGATVELAGESVEECLAMAKERAASSGEVLVHPFDDPAVIAGQGTLGIELYEEITDLGLVLVPLGGGGLASGVAVALKALRPDVRIVAVQAAACAPYADSIREGRPVTVDASATLADGIAVKRPGEVTLPIVQSLVDDVVTVGEDEIANAMVLVMERAKLVVEGAGAVGVAACLAGVIEPPAGRTTAVILSGGNVDTGLLAPAIRRHETTAGRRLVLFARISDRPGQLARLLGVVGLTGANLVAVEHLREGYDLHVRETAVHLVLETRNDEHARSVLQATEEAGYDIQRVGSAPPQLRMAGRP
jgi:threonine dehydratase